jgi:outer membrane protein assembly factor BamB
MQCATPDYLRIYLIIIGMALLNGCGGHAAVEEVAAGSSGLSVEDLAVAVSPTEWPWWRGPQGNGVAQGSAPTHWSGDQNVRWKTDIPGRGHSSPVVCGNAVYLATADDQAETQSILAIDRTNGDILWETIVHEGNFPTARVLHQKSTNANGTVACDGERVFAGFLNSQSIIATALDLDGAIVWQETLGNFNSKFGYAPSPLIYKSAVIFAADNRGGGHLSALNRKTGKTIWRKARPAIATYSSPIIARVGGRDQLLLSGCEQVVSFDPLTGSQNWSCPGTAEATCGTIVWNDSHVFASGGYPQNETICIDANGNKVWSNRRRAYEPSMLLYDGALYCLNDDGIAFCWDAATGKEHWVERLDGGKSFSTSPVIAGGLIYAVNAGGTTIVFHASTSGYREVARNQLGNDTFASPAICNGTIYLRVGESRNGRQEVLYCIDGAGR